LQPDAIIEKRANKYDAIRRRFCSTRMAHTGDIMAARNAIFQWVRTSVAECYLVGPVVASLPSQLVTTRGSSRFARDFSVRSEQPIERGRRSGAAREKRGKKRAPQRKRFIRPVGVIFLPLLRDSFGWQAAARHAAPAPARGASLAASRCITHSGKLAADGRQARY